MRLSTSSVSLLVASLLASCGGGSPNPSDLPDSGHEVDCADRADGFACGFGRICLGSSCEESRCGDGYVDQNAGEECDDGNSVEGDGCDTNCTLSCHDDTDCSDDDVCNGLEHCIEIAGGLKRCQAGTALDCEPSDGTASPCTTYVCDPALGCDPSQNVNTIVCYRDADGDDFPIESETADFTVGSNCDCPEGYMTRSDGYPWDCDDTRADVSPGQINAFSRPYCPGLGVLASDNDCGGGEPECPLFVCPEGVEPSFDFNCDGVEEITRTNVRADQTCGSLPCTAHGWLHTLPPCGVEGSWFECNSLGYSCGPTTTVTAQRCR